MRTAMLCLLCALGVLLGFGAGSSGPAGAAPPDQNVQPATPVPVNPIQGVVAATVGERVKPVDYTMGFAIEQYLENLGMEDYYTMASVRAHYLAGTFPGISFCGVYFEQWPVRVEPPEGMAQSDVFFMGADRQLLYLTGPDDLLEFFQEAWNPVVSATGHENALKDAAKTWLRLSQEFSQDGFYQFSKPVVEVIGQTAYGSVTVVQGGRGYIWVAMTIGPTGKLYVEEKRHVYPGIRPI